MPASSREIKQYIWGYYGSEEALLRSLPQCPLQFNHRIYIHTGRGDPMAVGDIFILVSLLIARPQ
jgi:hypothetical protein